MPVNLENSAVATGLEMVSFHSNPKECSNYCTLHSFHMWARSCTKSFKLGFNSMWTKSFQKYKLDLEKAEEPEIKLQPPLDYRKSKRIPGKNLLLLHWLCGSQQTVENSSRDGNIRPLTCLLRNLYVGQEVTVRTRHGKRTGLNSRKEYIKALYCHPTYLIYIQIMSCDASRWMKHKLKSRLPGETSITSDMQITPPLWQKVKRN